MIKSVDYDREADAIYIYFSNGKVTHTKQIDDMRYIDYDVANCIIGIELLNVSDGVITDNLPHRAEIEKALADNGIKVYA